MGLPALHGNYLPHGRWACSPADVEAAFVIGQGPERASIWQDWLQAAALLKQLVGTVPAAWLSGSFFTSKPVPGDIDSVFIVDTKDLQAAYQSLSADDWRIVLALAGDRSSGAIDLGLRVDSYMIEWCPTPTAVRDPLASYYADRGYWDDLWVRARDADPRVDSVPRRGYVEVMIDGYR